MRSDTVWEPLYKQGAFAPRPPVEGPAAPPTDTLELLDRFAREVPSCTGTENQVRLALHTVREATGANAVYCCPGADGGPLEVLSDLDLPRQWCLDFARRQLLETPGVDGRLFRAALPPSGDRTQPSPRSVAMVRLSRTRKSWLVALSFAPSPALQVRDLRFLSVVRQMLVNQYRRDRLYGGLTDTLHWLVQCLTTSIEARVPHARGHSERVAQLAVHIARHMHLPRPVLSDIYFAGLLHDIGLTSVRESVLLKPDRLTQDELVQVRRSPLVGDRMLAEIRQIAHLRPAVRNHHEWFDGSGYPDGLAGDSIPLMARILAVADGFDALTSPRPYRPAMSVPEGVAVLTNGAGRQWDPDVVNHLLACRPAFEKVWKSQEAAPVGVRQAVEKWTWDTSREQAADVGTNRFGLVQDVVV